MQDEQRAPEINLDGRVALVTGGSGGIGRAIALALSAAGVSVAIGYGANDASAHQLAGQITAAGGRAAALSADLGYAAEIMRLAEEAEHAFGPVDILVNNAGMGRVQNLESIAVEDFDEMIGINLRAPFLLSQASARVMSGGGSIVNIGSIGGRTANPGNVPYGVSKTALLGLTQHLALEWGPLGIRVNAVNPGMTTSSMNGLVVPDAVKAAQSDLVPLRRLPDPSDVADAVVFLASARARSITGTVVDVDGGYLLSLMSTLPRGEMRPGSAST
jgi:3-oxoacyl-[acyl-carrier protein] reductase